MKLEVTITISPNSHVLLLKYIYKYVEKYLQIKNNILICLYIYNDVFIVMIQ